MKLKCRALFNPLLPTTLLPIRFCCHFKGLLVMVQINTKMSFIDLGLRTKKFFFWSYMTNSACPYMTYVIYDQFGTPIYDSNNNLTPYNHNCLWYMNIWSDHWSMNSFRYVSLKRNTSQKYFTLKKIHRLLLISISSFHFYHEKNPPQ